MLEEINAHLESQGLRLREGTIVDASIIEVPSSTKNRAEKRDPEQFQSCFMGWTQEVAFREDQCRIRKDYAPQKMATPRQISHNLLKKETNLKVGIQGKRLRAGWREDYLQKVLLG